jgi:hypothetical protein
LTGCGGEDISRYAAASGRERTHAGGPVLRMIEDVIKLRPQFEELCFTDINSFHNVKVPVVLTGSPQRIAAEIATPSGACQQSNVLCVRRINTRIRGIRIGVKSCANRHATWIDCGRSNCGYRPNSGLTVRVEIRTIEVATNRIGILAIHDCERHSGFECRST